jgi:PilZ domain
MTHEGNTSELVAQGLPSGQERRAAPRQASTLKVTCYPAGAGLLERRQGRVRNVSRSGIGLVVDRRWEAGTALIVELPVEDGVRPVRARVVHATQQLGGLFLTGCSLEKHLTDEEVQGLAR